MEGIPEVFNEGVEWDAFRAQRKLVIAAGGLVQDEHGRLLVMFRLGKWDLPKGKVDRGEAIEAAAIREVQEECGLQRLTIERDLPSTWHTYERGGVEHLKRTDWFFMQGSSDEVLTPQLEEDIQEVKWITREQLPAVLSNTYPALVDLFKMWDGRLL